MGSSKAATVVDLTGSDNEEPARQPEKSRKSAHTGPGTTRNPPAKHGKSMSSKQGLSGTPKPRNGNVGSGTPVIGETPSSKQRHVDSGDAKHHGAGSLPQSRSKQHARPNHLLETTSGRAALSPGQSSRLAGPGKPNKPSPATPTFKTPRGVEDNSSQKLQGRTTALRSPSKTNESNPLKRPLDSDKLHSDGTPQKKSKIEVASNGLLSAGRGASSHENVAQRSRKMVDSAKKKLAPSGRPTPTIDLTKSPSPERLAPKVSSAGQLRTNLTQKAAGLSREASGKGLTKLGRTAKDSPKPSAASNRSGCQEVVSSGQRVFLGPPPPRPSLPTDETAKKSTQHNRATHNFRDGGLPVAAADTKLLFPRTPIAKGKELTVNKSTVGKPDGTAARLQAQGKSLSTVPAQHNTQNPQGDCRVAGSKAFRHEDPSVAHKSVGTVSSTRSTRDEPLEGTAESNVPLPPPTVSSTPEAGSPHRAKHRDGFLSTTDVSISDTGRPKAADSDSDYSKGSFPDPSKASPSKHLDPEAHTGPAAKESSLEASGSEDRGAKRDTLTDSTSAATKAAPSFLSGQQLLGTHQHVPSPNEEADLQLRTEAMEWIEQEPLAARAPTEFAVPTFAASAVKAPTLASLPLPNQVERVLGKHIEEMHGDNEYWTSTFLQRARSMNEDGRASEPSTQPSPFASMKPIRLSPQHKNVALDKDEGLWKIEKIGPNRKALGVNGMTVRFMTFLTKTRDVPNYAHYVSLQNNLLAPNMPNLHCWPYFGDDFEMSDANNLRDQYNLDIDLREEKLLLLLKAQIHEAYVEGTLQDLECSWADVLRYLIETKEKDDRMPAKNITQKQQEEEKRSRTIDNLSAKSSRSKAVLATLPPTSPEKRARVEALCENFKKMAKFSLWHVARRSREAKPSRPEDDVKDAVGDVTCTICLRVSCPLHGELNERPEEESDSTTSTQKDKVLATDIVNPLKSNYRARVVFPPDAPEPSTSVLNFRTQSKKRQAMSWHSPQFRKQPSQLGPFYPCHHPGSSCEDAKCSCYEESRPCEKTCACSAQCSRRFQGCSCAKKGMKCFNDSDCACFFTGRECDPDLCGTCGVCEVVDPVNRYDEDAVNGKCRNANIQRGVSKQTLLGDSGVHGLGLYACEDVREHDFVGEYKGEIITKEEAERRGAVYEHQKLTYLFKLNATQEIDSTYFGNKVRFINHASVRNANLYPRIIMVNAVHRIALYANRNIIAGQELFFDYGPEFPDDHLGGKKSEKSAPHVRNANLVKGFVDMEESEDEVGNLRAKAVDRPVAGRGKAKGKRGGPRPGSGRKPKHAASADTSHTEYFTEAGQRLQAFNISDEVPLFDPMEVDEEAGADDEDYEEDEESEVGDSSEVEEESEDE